ncbi:hypothetical protein DRP05_15085 [Archaeoglobales archaeon]|nr:MAG: hypothetical protein DRP05_15085 [Archaeoglobales archaeon]
MQYLKLTPVFLDIETTGLSPLNDEIVAVGIRTIDFKTKQYNPWEYEKFLDNKILTRKDFSEDELISAALHYLMREGACIIGYNVIGFDIPFITARALFNKHNVRTLSLLRQQYRIDLMHVVTRYLLTNNRHVKLNDITQFLGIEVNNQITGKDIPDLYEKGEFEKIEEHCFNDLENTYHLFMKLKDLCIHNLQRRYNLDCTVVFEGL